MKVVLFCGGLGMRLRDYSEHDPQAARRRRSAADPVAPDEVLRPLRAQGLHPLPRARRAQDQGVLPPLRRVRRPTTSCCPTVGGTSSCSARDIDDWKITFVDTGLDSQHRRTPAAGRALSRVTTRCSSPTTRTVCPTSRSTSYLDDFLERDKIACFLTVPVPHTFHIVHTDEDGRSTGLEPVVDVPVRINAGFFVFRREIFDYMRRARSWSSSRSSA